MVRFLGSAQPALGSLAFHRPAPTGKMIGAGPRGGSYVRLPGSHLGMSKQGTLSDETRRMLNGSWQQPRPGAKLQLSQLRAWEDDLPCHRPRPSDTSLGEWSS